jgi:hypothetical protein
MVVDFMGFKGRVDFCGSIFSLSDHGIVLWYCFSILKEKKRLPAFLTFVQRHFMSK